MVITRALEELQIKGEFDEQVAEKYPTIVSLIQDVLNHDAFAINQLVNWEKPINVYESHV